MLRHVRLTMAEHFYGSFFVGDAEVVTKRPVIIHADLDAFFAAVEQRDDPRLRGRPVVIGADPKGGKGRGVVSTCSYEARRFGIHSAMPISQAYRLCPQAAFLPANGRKYRTVSKDVFKIFYDFTPHIEPISIDEAFLDISGSYHLFGSPRDTGMRLKKAIYEKTQLTISVGISSVKMVAKIASDFCKPDGLLEVKEGRVFEFLKPLAIERLWGVGSKTKRSLNLQGIKIIGDLAALSLPVLQERYGERGQHLYYLAHGIDFRTVQEEDDVKSVSHEHTFDRDTDDKEEILKNMLRLSEKVSRRLRRADLKGRTLTVKIRLKGFRTFTRACTFSERTNFTDTIYKEAKKVFFNFYKRGYKIRLIGVRVSNFHIPYMQDSLFSDEGDKKLEQIHKVVDRIKDKYGERAIHRAR